MSGQEGFVVAVVDPDEEYLVWAEKHLSADDVEIVTLTDAAKAVPYCLEQQPDLVIAEMEQARISGLDLLKQVRQKQPDALVVLTSAFPPTNMVIEAMKWGAYEFLRKEALAFDLKRVVESALQAREEMRRPPAEDEVEGAVDGAFIGTSAAMQEVSKLVGKVSRGDAPVLVTGESGSGKEVVARAIHQFSLRAKKEFVAINCAAIPDNLLESELFGHEKGAFTGASVQRIGRFEQCDGGTLFLDEIGDMPLQTQGKILRVLQEGEFSRVGGNETLRSDVRILAATNKNLEKEVEGGTFSEGHFFYRLNVVRIHIPSLRERPEDILLLAEFFLKRTAQQKRSRPLRLTDAAREFLLDYSWPGNVRELENALYRACALANTSVLFPQDIPLAGAGLGRVDDALAALLGQAGREGIGFLEFLEQEAIRYVQGQEPDREKAAEALGLTAAELKKRADKQGG